MIARVISKPCNILSVSFLFLLTLFFLELVTFVINLSLDSPNETFAVWLDMGTHQGFSFGLTLPPGGALRYPHSRTCSL